MERYARTVGYAKTFFQNAKDQVDRNEQNEVEELLTYCKDILKDESGKLNNKVVEERDISKIISFLLNSIIETKKLRADQDKEELPEKVRCLKYNNELKTLAQRYFMNKGQTEKIKDQIAEHKWNVDGHPLFIKADIKKESQIIKPGYCNEVFTKDIDKHIEVLKKILDYVDVVFNRYDVSNKYDAESNEKKALKLESIFGANLYRKGEKIFHREDANTREARSFKELKETVPDIFDTESNEMLCKQKKDKMEEKEHCLYYKTAGGVCYELQILQVHNTVVDDDEIFLKVTRFVNDFRDYSSTTFYFFIEGGAKKAKKAKKQNHDDDDNSKSGVLETHFQTHL